MSNESPKKPNSEELKEALLVITAALSDENDKSKQALLVITSTLSDDNDKSKDEISDISDCSDNFTHASMPDLVSYVASDNQCGNHQCAKDDISECSTHESMPDLIEVTVDVVDIDIDEKWGDDEQFSLFVVSVLKTQQISVVFMCCLETRPRPYPRTVLKSRRNMN